MANTSITDSLNDVNNYLETGQMFNQEITQRQLQMKILDLLKMYLLQMNSLGGYGLNMRSAKQEHYL